MYTPNWKTLEEAGIVDAAVTRTATNRMIPAIQLEASEVRAERIARESAEWLAENAEVI